MYDNSNSVSQRTIHGNDLPPPPPLHGYHDEKYYPGNGKKRKKIFLHINHYETKFFDGLKLHRKHVCKGLIINSVNNI